MLKHKIINSMICFAFLSTINLYAGEINMALYQGWNLKGVSQEISDLNVLFNKPCVKKVMAYDLNTRIWKTYMPNKNNTLTSIEAFEGFWIYTGSDCTITDYDLGLDL